MTIIHVRIDERLAASSVSNTVAVVSRLVGQFPRQDLDRLETLLQRSLEVGCFERGETITGSGVLMDLEESPLRQCTDVYCWMYTGTRAMDRKSNITSGA